MWVSILEAAGLDPLRAQKIEEELGTFWWDRYHAYRTEQALVEKDKARKQEAKSRRKSR